MQQYQEDKLNVLGLAKEIGSAYINPLTRAMYTPSAWSPTSGAFRLTMPWEQGTLINNKTTRGFASWVGNKTGLNAWRAERAGESIQSGGFTFKNHRTNPSIVQASMKTKPGKSLIAGPLQYKNGWITGTTAKEDQISRLLRANKLNAKRNLRSFKRGFDKEANDINRLSGQIESSVQERLNNNDVHAKRPRKTKKAWKKNRASINTSLDRQINLNKLDLKFLDETRNGTSRGYGRWFSKSTGKASLKMNLAGATLLEKSYQGARFAGKVAGRTSLAIGKGYSMYMVAQLMYQGAKLLTDPITNAGVNAIDNTYTALNQLGSRDMGGQLSMDYITAGAATERQRAIQAISKSRINGRSMLGSEAQYMH